MGAFACTTCKIIRRFLLAFGLGGFLASQLTVTLPGQAGDEGVMWVAVLFTALSIFLRMRQIGGRWRR